MTIEMSTDEQHDAELGPGVYLTDLPPDTDDEDIIHNNWGYTGTASALRKIKWYVELHNLRGVRKVKVGNGRIIYVYGNNIDLTKVSHIIRQK